MTGILFNEAAAEWTSLHVPDSNPARRDDYGHCLACMYSLRSTCTPPKRRDSWVTLTCLINLETGIHSTGHSERQTHKDGMKTINCCKHARFILLPVMAKKKRKNEVIDFSLSFYVRSKLQRGKKKHRLKSKPNWPLAPVSVHNTHSRKCMVSKRIPSSGARFL